MFGELMHLNFSPIQVKQELKVHEDTIWPNFTLNRAIMKFKYIKYIKIFSHIFYFSYFLS